ncbi:uncharacterized protein LOC129762363 [Toxorhynchites rutilus septentrionalis]|uniref:uncharacterized protein LOC129762363 n=1 Tax=Toxorhynchites rutilus septentrionalis TaxID=329112 RepID=UPI002478EE0B|nr:uncharacterized protein LOC129762363 [Toxorhynchites rutilus septentrionalis]
MWGRMGYRFSMNIFTIVPALLLVSSCAAQYLGHAVSYQYHSHGGTRGFSYSFAHPFPQHQESSDHQHQESTPEPIPEVEHNPHHAALSELKKFFLVNGIDSIPYYEPAPVQNTQVESTTWHPGSQQIDPPVEKLAPLQHTDDRYASSNNAPEPDHRDQQYTTSLSEHSIPVSEQQQDTGWYNTEAPTYAPQSEDPTTTQSPGPPDDQDRAVVGYDGTRRYVPVYESSLGWRRPQYVPEPPNQLLPPPKPHRSSSSSSKSGKGSRHHSRGKRRHKSRKSRKNKHRGSNGAALVYEAVQGRELEDDEDYGEEDYTDESDEKR